MEDLFTKPIYLPRPKKFFYQKLEPLPRPRKLAHPPINLSVASIDKFEEKEIMVKRAFTKNT